MKPHHFPWKVAATLSVVLLWCAMAASPVQAATVFFIGVDNGNNSEFEQEGSDKNNNLYYWENGDYTNVTSFNGTTGVNWTNGQEIWQDGPNATDWSNSTDGFIRAITNSWATHHIFFQLDPEEVVAGNTLTFTIDFINPGQPAGGDPTSHDVRFYFDDVLIHTELGINGPRTVEVTGIDASQFEAGSHVLSWHRFAGVNGWINIDYVSLVVVPEPSRALLLILSLGTMLMGRRR